MKAYIIAGMTGTGKSTFAKKLIGQICKGNVDSVFCYDINNEHGDNGYNIIDPRKYEINQFLYLLEQQKNKIAFIDEATIFFSSRSYSKPLTKLLTLKRHMNITYIFVFHSIRKIPPEILDMCNGLFLFKTSDRLSIVENKLEGWPDVVEAWKKGIPNYKPYFQELI